MSLAQDSEGSVQGISAAIVTGTNAPHDSGGTTAGSVTGTIAGSGAGHWSQGVMGHQNPGEAVIAGLTAPFVSLHIAPRRSA
jgi:hypothetical protein